MQCMHKREKESERVLAWRMWASVCAPATTGEIAYMFEWIACEPFTMDGRWRGEKGHGGNGKESKMTFLVFSIPYSCRFRCQEHSHLQLSIWVFEMTFDSPQKSRWTISHSISIWNFSLKIGIEIACSSRIPSTVETKWAVPCWWSVSSVFGNCLCTETLNIRFKSRMNTF